MRRMIASSAAFKQGQKFIDYDSVEYGLLRAAQGDAARPRK